MKKKSWFASVIVAAVISISVIILSGCKDTSLDTALKNTIVFQYDHVANAHEIRFNNPLQIPGHFGINSVTPKSGGFWAVFVLCSLDVQGNAIQTFNYNVSNFVVEYEGQSYGPLQPGMVRYGVSTSGISCN